MAREWAQGDGAVIRRNPDLLAAEMDGELVMMSVESGAYFGIKGVGTRIWELIEGPIAFDDLVARLCGEYDVDAQQCRRDCAAFVNELAANGMILPG